MRRGVTAMAFVKLIELERCRRGRGTFVACGERELAVFLLGSDEQVVVIDNACPHASGNLAEGDMSGTVVTCPWHDWDFDLSTGLCVDSERARVRRYAVEVRDACVFVDVDTTF